MPIALITGADGFIGSRLVELLVKKGYKIKALSQYNSFNNWGWLDDIDSVNEFESSLNELGIQNDINIYLGVDHAFANPSGERYAPDESKDAWGKTIDFFESNLK